ncbi:hypothetical protein GCM10017691_19710 [Pseudonocardia petroleophila]|uniref:Uncharacterized protein n=1 Tax=Pseudonocardia petroleophila TaxID=37331 RepID=A0A7G7MGW0_9PSEU|nr:hypothetical protein [Pseudonocardia petroleophila]QNG52021.1 hypothetical protein H6H00_28780 [Pseudonocardia petroleophila]
MDLDVNIAGQVTSHSVVRADLGHDGRSIVVVSGIALPEWRVDTDEMTRTSARVLLRQPADIVEQSTVTVSLASISNEESSFGFAVDQAELAVEADELVLATRLSLMGEASFLHRFSFQVVLAMRDVPAQISGELVWNTSQFRPAETTPAAAQRAFVIEANAVTVTDGPPPSAPPPGVPGTLPTGTIDLRPVASGQIVSVTVGEQTCRASYVIANPPKLKRLIVTVGAPGLHAVGTGTIGMRATGEADFTLTPAAPTREHVDFASHHETGPA